VKENNPIERMRQMYIMIKSATEEIKPDFVVLEGVQFQQNYRTYSQLSQLQGVLFSILFELDIGFVICESTAWKKHIGVQGRKRDEQKLSTIQIIKERFGIVAEEDIADAIGLGCWSVDNIKKDGVR
jgi:Holliday junction resolvasome RuvABC endonuclease subunit